MGMISGSFGVTSKGKEATLYTITNKSGMSYGFLGNLSEGYDSG